MTYGYIHKTVHRIVHSCGSRDPIRIAKELGIHIGLNYNYKILKGMYTVVGRSRFITLNGNLNDRDRKTVCAHEIVHDILHRKLAKSKVLQEVMLYNMRGRVFGAYLTAQRERIFNRVISNNRHIKKQGEIINDTVERNTNGACKSNKPGVQYAG